MKSDGEAAGRESEWINTIILMRIYDLLLLLLTESNTEVALKAAQLHQTGEFIGPEPAFRVPDDAE